MVPWMGFRCSSSINPFRRVPPSPNESSRPHDQLTGSHVVDVHHHRSPTRSIRVFIPRDPKCPACAPITCVQWVCSLNVFIDHIVCIQPPKPTNNVTNPNQYSQGLTESIQSGDTARTHTGCRGEHHPRVCLTNLQDEGESCRPYVSVFDV